ncbi:MAG: hypothetical protein KKD44_27285 [Proteobacteria bacterium]|nr:hypothetical protein [Pseudomonadota bacterium]
MNMTFLVIAGLLCFNGNNCVDVPYNVTVHITDDTPLLTKMCWASVAGCAPISKREVWVIDSQGGWRHKYSTLFHELMHYEYYAKGIRGHPQELLDREDLLRYSLGLPSKYISKENYEYYKQKYAYQRVIE